MVFATLPIERAPDERRQLAANERAFDSERLQTALLGLVGHTRRLPGAIEAGAYLYVLKESDDGSRLTRDRSLFTPGLRLWRAPRPAQWDGEIELAVQIGQSRATALAEDTRDLDHRAGFLHLHIGHTLDGEGRPRLALEFDYASGDGDPTDGDNGHFDTLYGARRFEYGPTGIFDPFSRANLVLPGARFEFAPHERLMLMFGYRAAWLARRRDAMDGTDLRDPSGRSGRYIGQQVETRLRWNAIANHLNIEAGAAHLFHGRFLRSAPGAPDEGDSTYLYLQTTVSY